MARGTLLTEAERVQILAYNQCGRSNRWIARQIRRSHDVVNVFLRDPQLYGTKKSTGRPQKLSERDKRRVVAAASNSTNSCATIKANLDLDVSRETIRTTIKKSGHIRRAKMQKAPALTERHKARRLEFARQNRHTDFSTFIWSDEKKWNLDGPDGWRNYWRDLRKEPKIFSRRNFGGGTLMVWAAFSVHGKLRLAFPSARMNSEEYQEVLDGCLLPFLEDHNDVPFQYQQDNAPIHVSRSSRGWFERSQLPLVDWPPCSPDLNVIENVWAILARRVYAENRQFRTVDELKRVILAEWDALDQNLLQNLVRSMDERLDQVRNRAGGATDY